MALRHDINPQFFSRRHPTYAEKFPHWQFVEATYEGGPDWFKTNIHKGFREGDKEFEGRLKRAYRFNHTREVVDLVTKHVFARDVERATDAPDELLAFWKSATYGGQPIDRLMETVSRDTSLLGQPYLVVDSTAAAPEAGGSVTLADQKKNGDRVFAYVVKPQDALDMSFDDQGELNWFLHREMKREDSDFFADHASYAVFRLWTRTSWHVFRVREASSQELQAITQRRILGVNIPKIRASADTASADQKLVVEEIESGEHNLGIVPVLAVSDRDSDVPYHAGALVDDIAYLDRATANYLSNLDAIIQDQTFSILTIPVQSLDRTSDEYDTLVELGTKRVFAYDAEGGIGPEFISSDPKQAELILAVITKIITEIYHSVGMAGERTKMDNAAGIDNSSGVAKAYDFDRMNTMLCSKASRLQRAENRLNAIVLAWSSKKPAKDFVKYPEEFDVRGLYDEFDVANRLALLAAPDELRRHQMEMLVDKIYPTLSEDLKTKIKAELKKWPVDEVELAAEMAAATGKSQLRDRTKPAAENKQGQNNKD